MDSSIKKFRDNLIKIKVLSRGTVSKTLFKDPLDPNIIFKNYKAASKYIHWKANLFGCRTIDGLFLKLLRIHAGAEYDFEELNCSNNTKLMFNQHIIFILKF